ncbi:uncharacterized protein LOC113280606 [Papaver somniferum]|uniref:uncharacterized protein LOC113280606 n=1 Tax=Papaver somniferum TaxID=3469 RepID=UPI000E7020D7|nr:uncharacterized protein LOC113280606 [Papaver somniferum]
MKKDMPNIISHMQFACVLGRLNSENICIVQEIVQAMKRKEGKAGHLALKMDMSKAFDRLEWTFLINVRKEFGFGDKFCQLVHQCISSTQIEIMLNGAPTALFFPSRGIRQGGPLSPYLFILAMESFSGYLAYYEDNDTLTGMNISCSAPKINHLLFADDCILFCKSNQAHTSKLLQVINHFSSCSGQIINFNKSALFFSSNMEPTDIQDVSGFLQIRELNIKEEKCLVLPFFVGRNKRIPFFILVDKMDHKFSKWNASNMSETSRVQQFLWKAISNLLSTKEALGYNVVGDNNLCPLCDQHVESADHLFMSCTVARLVWFTVWDGLLTLDLVLQTGYLAGSLIIRNCAGEQQGARCIFLKDLRHAEQAECMELWEAVKWAKELQLAKVLVFATNLSALRYSHLSPPNILATWVLQLNNKWRLYIFIIGNEE